MGFKNTLKNIMGRSQVNEPGALSEDDKTSDALKVSGVSGKTDKIYDAVPGKKAATNNVRQVGSKWEHWHDDYDWHSMSIPHPVTEISQADTPAVKDAPAKAASSAGPAPDKADDEKTITKQDILCKFVVQGGERIGETISVDSDNLVFKKGAEKLSIPMSSIQGITAEDVEVGDFDRHKALQLGEEWHRRTTDSLKFDDKGMLIND